MIIVFADQRFEGWDTASIRRGLPKIWARRRLASEDQTTNICASLGDRAGHAELLAVDYPSAGRCHRSLELNPGQIFTSQEVAAGVHWRHDRPFLAKTAFTVPKSCDTLVDHQLSIRKNTTWTRSEAQIVHRVAYWVGIAYDLLWRSMRLQDASNQHFRRRPVQGRFGPFWAIFAFLTPPQRAMGTDENINSDN